jgi:hypothetical protein
MGGLRMLTFETLIVGGGGGGYFSSIWSGFAIGDLILR